MPIIMDADFLKKIDDSIKFVESLEDMGRKLVAEGFEYFSLPTRIGQWNWIKEPMPEEINEALGGFNDFYGWFFRDEDEEYKTTSNMLDKGGDFVKKVAGLYQFADYDNKRRLITTFREYFNNYKK